MPTALFLSPHLDDVAFSCAGTLLRLQRAGWDTPVVTVFTLSVPHPQGFALRCQTDKGIAPSVDYMALRRAEDAEFARLLGISDAQYWPLPEAPHRGYDAPPALFAGMRFDDTIWHEVAERLRAYVSAREPQLVFAPQGLGNHVDHLQLIRAVHEAGLAGLTLWYRDTPYAIREPDAQPSPLLPQGLGERAVPLDAATVERKVVGSCAYASQIEFQFGGAQAVRDKLTQFHAQEAERTGLSGYAERFLVPAPLWLGNAPYFPQDLSS